MPQPEEAEEYEGREPFGERFFAFINA